MNLSIVSSEDRRLRKKCGPLTLSELRTKKTQRLIEDMLDVVYGTSNKGESRNTNKPMTVGLSANQVGINKRISVIDLGIGRKSYNDIFVLINPEIIWRSKMLKEFREGCVSLPTIWGYIKRSYRIKVRAFDRSGNGIMLDLKGWSAILMQHEIDHLDGKLFIDHLENPKKAHLVKEGEYKAHKKAKKNWNKFIDVSDLAKK